ncbi:MAG: hypothetical protein ACTSO9_15890 [Candidatus Helarchaeota archaeon]
MPFGVILKFTIVGFPQEKSTKYIIVRPDRPIAEIKKIVKEEFGLDPSIAIALSVSFEEGDSFHLTDDITLKQIIKNKTISQIFVYLPSNS